MRDLPSPLLGLLALLALPLVVALYATLLFALCALARHSLHYLLTL